MINVVGGNIRCLVISTTCSQRLPPSDTSFMEIMPTTGKIGINELKASSSRMATQKAGAEYPARENIITAELKIPSGFIEARQPENVPKTVEQIKESMKSKAVAGNRSNTTLRTG